LSVLINPGYIWPSVAGIAGRRRVEKKKGGRIMNVVGDLVEAAGLTAPRSRVDTLSFFQVRGDCLSPLFQDGDIVFATWRLLPVEKAALRRDEVAVFLVQWPGEGRVAAVLNRWSRRDGQSVSLASNEGPVTLAGDRVSLVANHVHLARRGGRCDPGLLSGTVYAGLDLWFAEDVKRIVDSTYEAMGASRRAATPLDPSMQSIATAEAYEQGFVDALRAVGVASCVTMPRHLPTATVSSRLVGAGAPEG
jgi:hypothetical protein